MTKIDEYRRGRRDGVRVAITWLHEEARNMNDPHARQVLNSAGFHLGLMLREDEQLYGQFVPSPTE